ncbi:MAG: 16S rRNA (cytosine(1402)-N(4))-methyltransferase RsmH, partial [Beijerinckiaceae bacterium]|nr:16S rRNA (cytosine(1402)-N(4))-methyltransferase RsmH [Beijerinckiaceae bacterium]
MMQDSGGSDTPATGGPVPHVPVLLEAATAALAPHENQTFIDGTFGAGGYTRWLLKAGAGRVLAIDRDPTAISAGQAMVQEFGDRLVLVQGVFGEMDNLAVLLGFAPVDGVVLDIGVSSMQLDQAHRGFSFRQDGPLDMRMGGSGPTAADLVNETPADDLANIIYRYGDERASRRIARAIAVDRLKKPFTTTLQLAGMIARIMPHKPNDIH